jgi:hypothetical protein
MAGKALTRNYTGIVRGIVTGRAQLERRMVTPSALAV